MPGRPILLDVPKRAFLYYFAENSLEKKKKKTLYFLLFKERIYKNVSLIFLQKSLLYRVSYSPRSVGGCKCMVAVDDRVKFQVR